MTYQKPKVALVTGANRGIGRAVAHRLIEHGVTVIAGMRRLPTDLAITSRAAELAPELLAVELDVASPSDVTQVRDLVIDRFGRLDILINNAGVYLDRPGTVTTSTVEETDPDLLRATLAVNLDGPLRLIWAFLAGMRDRNFGRIVNVSSGRARFSDLNGAGPFYRISKTALNALTRIVAVDTAGYDILVNAVCPGWVRTDMGGPAAARSGADAADGIVWAALLPSGGPTGGFFRDSQSLDWSVKNVQV
jgi:NAD(P)-dependent dehydrogenase (short-subunit alcohol dehydrogenase family)